jgi:membrane-associated phospholipid phosphatase
VLAYLVRPWRIAALTLAVIVPLYRMYVAAHVPLDLIGGAALGVTVASAVNLLLLRPAEDSRGATVSPVPSSAEPSRPEPPQPG